MTVSLWFKVEADDRTRHALINVLNCVVCVCVCVCLCVCVCGVCVT
jgi:hypothetical protein